MLSVIVFLLLGGCVWLLYELRRLQQENLVLKAGSHESEDELKKVQASQSQVIQTTKLASLGQMVAGVAHEINTPLGFVKSNVEVVGDLLDDYRKLVMQYDTAVQYCLQPVDLIFGADKASLEKLVKHVEEARRKLFEARAAVEKSPLLTDAKELLGDASDGLGQLATLVQNLKGFSRVDRDGMDSMDLNEGVESALMIAQHQLRDRVKVVKHLQPLPKVTCMASQINQVFLNLITNAAQAIEHADGRITLRTHTMGHYALIAVEDNGKGIPQQNLERIFEPFFTTKPIGQGTGLGLSICYQIIEQHRGRIRATSSPGMGTRFLVALPTPGHRKESTP